MNIKLLEGIITAEIMDENPQVLDDDIPDLLQDAEKRKLAIETLIKILTNEIHN